MTFLLHDLNKVESRDFTTGTLTKLLEVFKMVAKEKSMDKLREHLQDYMLMLLEKRQEKRDIQLNIYDEAILRLHEVLHLFSCQMPKDLKDDFLTIYKEKIGQEGMTPAKMKDGKMKEFFVYAENKTLWKVCDALSGEAVTQMYDNLKNNKKMSFYDTASAEDLKNLTVSLSDMKNIEGLKEALFYCFVLALFKEGHLNRIHTHNLISYLVNDKETDDVSLAISQLERYPLGSKLPGLCIIFNVEENRPGAEHDFGRINYLFEKTFSYDVSPVINPTKDAVSEEIKKLEADKYKFYDSLVVVFMAHGDEKHLYVAEGKPIHRRKDLIEPITKIKWLAKKPKLFFLQACASDDEKDKQKSDGLAAATDDCMRHGYKKPKLAYHMHNLYGGLIKFEDLNPFSDTLISYATKWYDVAVRYEGTGSPYINILVDQLRRFGTREPIEVVLRRVHYDINLLSIPLPGQDKPHRQAPYFESSLQKVFMFPQTMKSPQKASSLL